MEFQFFFFNLFSQIVCRTAHHIPVFISQRILMALVKFICHQREKWARRYLKYLYFSYHRYLRILAELVQCSIFDKQEHIVYSKYTLYNANYSLKWDLYIDRCYHTCPIICNSGSYILIKLPNTVPWTLSQNGWKNPCSCRKYAVHRPTEM